MSNSNRPRIAQLGAAGFLAVAFGCAALAAFMVSRMMLDRGITGERMVPVVVARQNLPAAEPVTEDSLEVVSWPERLVPAGAVADIQAVFELSKEPIPTTGIMKGEAIVPTRLASSKQGTGIAALLRPGFRAVAVKVDDSVGRAKLVYPGAHVDIMATIRDPLGRGPSTRIAVHNARVLSLEAETDVATRRTETEEEKKQGGSKQGTVVTLEVQPAEAEVVSLAMREGRIDLALRNGTDEEIVDTTGAVPVMFSAFAPTPEELEAAGGLPAAMDPQQQQRGRTAPPTARTSRASRSSGRKIDLRANDTSAPDVPARTEQIQTYYAR